MTSELIELQIESQALNESYRSAMVEYHAQRVKSEAQAAVAESALNHVNRLRQEVQACNKKLIDLHEKQQGQQELANRLKI